MKIKHTPKKSFLSNALSSGVYFFRQKIKTRLLLIGIVFIIIVLASFVFLKKKGYIEKITRTLPYIIHGYFVEPPDRMTIDMKFEDYLKLLKKRNEAVEFGFLMKEDDDEVPAVILYKGKKASIKIRLKGGFSNEHLEGKKWSFRIHVKGDETIMGMKRFSLQRPRARWYLNEWLYHKVLAREGIIALRYSFVNLTLNGRDWGLYAVEEHFGKELIEHNERREGLLVRYDDEDFFLNRARQWNSPLISGMNILGYYSSPVKTYELKKVLANPALMDQYKTAMELFTRLRNGQIELTDAYDVEMTARYFALNDLFGAIHGSLYPNAVIYYNPVTSKLEPVAFDTEDAMHDVELLSGEKYMMVEEGQRVLGQWIHYEILHLWKEEKFVKEYFRELERISRKEYIDQLISDLKGPAKTAIGHLWHLGSESFRSQSFRFVKSQLYRNAETIRKKLENEKGVYAYFVKADDKTLILKMGNPDTLPVEILSINYKGNPVAFLDKKTLLSPRKFYTPIEFQEFTFRTAGHFNFNKDLLSDLRVVYRLPGLSAQKEQPIFPWEVLDDEFFAQDFIRQKPDIHSYPFFIVDEKNKVIRVKPGQWDIKENVIIPAGWTVLVPAGVTLDLTHNAKILTYSSLQLMGEEEAPIQIISSDSTGQGVVVLKTKDASLLRYVNFKNLSNPHAGGWSLTGAVTFYESEVHIDHCLFAKNRSEDNLNIIRSHFLIRSSFVKDSAFDGIDFDFSRGKIENTSLVNSGNDAIDFSGSIIEVNNLFIRKTGDKGISVGERSEITLSNIEIFDAEIAIAVKDSSETTVSDLKINNAKLGLALYKKKPEFGFSTLTVNGLTMENVVESYMVQKGSALTIDGKSIQTNQEFVRKFLKQLKKKK